MQVTKCGLLGMNSNLAYINRLLALYLFGLESVTFRVGSWFTPSLHGLITYILTAIICAV